jgi:formate C-acetyltransferase
MYDPLPLYSSSLTGCLERGLDLTEGGAKYNSTALSLLGTATMIDSLYALKTLVFGKAAVSYADFRRIVAENFENNELLRRQILEKLPKHGTGSAELDEFSAAVLDDISGIAGQTNGRGGKYLPAFYPHDIYTPLGSLTGATPDGRLAGKPLSRGVSPSEFIATDSPLDLIHSLKAIDFTKYADSFCAELTLPPMDNTAENAGILTSVIRAFLDAEGSSLQFNLIDRNALLDARIHPDDHRNLFVRVCGYSAVFVYLSPATQNEILERAIR